MKFFRSFTFSLFRRLLLLSPLFLILFGFFGCDKGQKIKIGVIQIVEHESLDNAKQGFVDGLKELGYEDGKNIEFDFQIAGGEISNCASIAEKFVNDRKNLILAISTPCAQAATNATNEIPIIATAITDFEGSGIVKSAERPDTNVTGVSDLAPIDKIIELIPRLDKNAKKVGILYSTTDPSPQYQAETAEKIIKNLSLEPKLFAVSQAHEVQQVVEKLVNDVDALYTPIDKITFSAMPQISKIFEKNRKFVVCAEDAMVSKGAIATYGIDYYKIGQLAAQQAADILQNKKSPQNMPIEYLKDSKLNLNRELILNLGLEISDDLEDDAA